MAAVITSDTLGLFGSSLNGVGNIGPGTSNIGRGSVYVNAATGNLILRQQDENLVGQGMISYL